MGGKGVLLTFCHLTVLDIVAISRLMSIILMKRKVTPATMMAKNECMSSRNNSPRERNIVRVNQYSGFWHENQFSLSCSVKLPLESLYQSSVSQFLSACITREDMRVRERMQACERQEERGAQDSESEGKRPDFCQLR